MTSTHAKRNGFIEPSAQAKKARAAAQPQLKAVRSSNAQNDDHALDSRERKAQPFRVTRDDFSRNARGACWGWKQWVAIAPDIRKHLDEHGRVGFANAVDAAQRKRLPESQHRTPASLSVACAPTSSFDVEACVRYVTDHPKPESLIGSIAQAEQREEKRELDRARKRRYRAKLKRKTAAQPERKLDARETRTAELDHDFRAAIETDIERTQQVARVLHAQKLSETRTTSAAPVPQPKSKDALESFLATPIGVFVPALKAFMTQALADVLQPHHGLIAETVRAAVIDVVGAPTPALEKPSPEPEPIREIEQQLVVEPAQAKSEHATKHDESKTSESVAAKAEIEVDVQQAAHEALSDAPHDLESQIKLAAKALGVQTNAKRESVICVGLHPKVEQEVERFYGKAFRFVFKRPDAFNSGADLPASTDAILLCRKTLSKELIGLSRRYAIPVQNIPNTSSAVLWALKQTFPESAQSFSGGRH